MGLDGLKVDLITTAIHIFAFKLVQTNDEMKPVVIKVLSLHYYLIEIQLYNKQN